MGNSPGMPTPPDLQAPDQNAGAPPTAPMAPSNPTPAAPPKETFGQGVRRGAGGEPYFVDAQGNMTSARTAQSSPKGRFGSILAGAVMGALSGAGAARPGGIPSAELGGGFGAGAKAAQQRSDFIDQRNRTRAQQDFENKNTATREKNEDLAYKAQLHISDLTAIHMAHEIDEAKQNDPIRHEQLVNGATEGALSLENEAKNLGLINEREYKDYASVPKADMDKFNRQQVKIVAVPGGGVKVWDRTFDPRVTPNTTDFELRSLMGMDPKTGAPNWQVTGHVKAGAGTAAQQEAELDKERTQLLDAASKNATILKEKAEAQKDTSQAVLNTTQAKLMNTMGVNVPPGYTPPPNLFQASAADARDAITKSGAAVPPDFESMYAIGHYDADLNTLTNRPMKGMPQRDKNSALAYIRTFINPNFDQKNYDAVKGMEKEFASTRPNTAGGNLMSFNAAIGHTGQLYQASQLLAKNDLTALNLMANAVGAATGKSAPKVYDGIRTVLAGEAGRLMKQAAPDVKEMNDINTALDRSSSPQQFKDVTSAFAHAFLTKGEQSIWQYYNYTGKLPPSTFNPNTLKILQDMGIDPHASFPANARVALGGTANQNPNQPPAAVNIPGIPDGGVPVMRNGQPIGYRLSNTPAGQMIPLPAAPAAPQGQ
ncbi:MAG: hypothetical protein ACYDHE_11345 [Candidatus Acidiferrales bacterium]